MFIVVDVTLHFCITDKIHSSLLILVQVKCFDQASYLVNASHGEFTVPLEVSGLNKFGVHRTG